MERTAGSFHQTTPMLCITIWLKPRSILRNWWEWEKLRGRRPSKSDGPCIGSAPRERCATFWYLTAAKKNERSSELIQWIFLRYYDVPSATALGSDRLFTSLGQVYSHLRR